MPEGPPPGVEEEPVDSDDDIPMPEGLPPGREQGAYTPNDRHHPSHVPPAALPPQFPFPGAILPYPMPLMPPPPPPAGFLTLPPPSQFIPPPPPGFPGVPPPPPGFVIPSYPVPPTPGLPPLPPGFPLPPAPYSSMPAPMPPPPGFFPRKRSGPGQDPLSYIPHRTLQGHPSLPPKPGSVKTDAISTSAVVSAEPELRDLKKESTAFMPTSVKRKKATATPKVNAAPSVGTEEVEPAAPRPDLLSTLQGHFTPASPEPAPKKVKTGTKDDYTKFVEEIGDIL